MYMTVLGVVLVRNPIIHSSSVTWVSLHLKWSANQLILPQIIHSNNTENITWFATDKNINKHQQVPLFHWIVCNSHPRHLVPSCTNPITSLSNAKTVSVTSLCVKDSRFNILSTASYALCQMKVVLPFTSIDAILPNRSCAPWPSYPFGCNATLWCHWQIEGAVNISRRPSVYLFTSSCEVNNAKGSSSWRHDALYSLDGYHATSSYVLQQMSEGYNALLIMANKCTCSLSQAICTPQIAKFMGLAWGPSGSCRPQMGSILSPWIFL